MGASQGAKRRGRIKLGDTMGKFEGSMCHSLVAIMRGELISLVMQRNNVAIYLRVDCDEEDLPPVLEQQNDTCMPYFAVDSGMLQQKLLEAGTEHSVADVHGVGMFIERTENLIVDHAARTTGYGIALVNEEEHATGNGRSIWTRPRAVKEGGVRSASDL